MAFELAYNLRMTVADVYSRMSHEEFVGWYHYFEARPVGWRSDDRAYKFLQTQGVTAAPASIFRSLQSIYNPVRTREQEIRSSSIFSMMVSAKGGDKLTIFE